MCIATLRLALSSVALLLSSCASAPSIAAVVPVRTQVALPQTTHVLVVILENVDASSAMRQPFHQELARRGALLTNAHALTHPSQPNYIAMTSGSMHGVRNNWLHDLDVRHLGDLVEERGLTWKVYAENYPGGCFLGAHHGSKRNGQYVRRHVPFLSYVNVTGNRERCEAHVVDASELDRDLAAGTFPNLSFYIPDNQHNGHDSGIEAADRWLQSRFDPLLANPALPKDLLFVVTFDESGADRHNSVATLLVGASVAPGARSDRRYNHYTLLRTIEEVLRLGTLGLYDAITPPVDDIWK